MELHKHFDQLATKSSWQSPLAVIAHIDLDAFYAQCQTVSNNFDPSEPLGCRQWQSLIAVNYPARKFGIKRGMTVSEAREKCPQIHLPHVATFKKGETQWHLVDDPDVQSYKVSLDMFRAESRKIFRIFKASCKMVEKAGIDEGFIDLGPQIHAIALEKFPELHSTDPNSELPPVPENIDLKWDGHLIQDQPFDTWHSVFMAIGSNVVQDLRMQVHAELKYTCSAGLAPNKVLAKLGSAAHKPFQQTVVPSSQVFKFLESYKLEDAWGWGGKHGSYVATTLELPEEDQFGYIRKFPLEELQRKLQDPKTASSLLDLAWGQLSSEVTSRTAIKSMASVKQFRNHPLKTPEDIRDWVKVYCADLAGRINDVSADAQTIYRPKVACVRYARGNKDHSKQFECKSLMSSSSDTLADDLNKIVLSVIETQLSLLPTSMLAVEISHIEEMPKERITFQRLKRGPSSELSSAPSSARGSGSEPEHKAASEQTEHDPTQNPGQVPTSGPVQRPTHDPVPAPTPGPLQVPTPEQTEPQMGSDDSSQPPHSATSLFVDETHRCERCSKSVSDIDEHRDWHFAMDLQDQENKRPAASRVPTAPNTPTKAKPTRAKTKAQQSPRKKAKVNTDSKQGRISDFFKR